MSVVSASAVSVAAGAGVAFFMGVQRYALQYPVFLVPFPGKLKLKRPHAWAAGLCGYIVCNVSCPARAPNSEE